MAACILEQFFDACCASPCTPRFEQQELEELDDSISVVEFVCHAAQVLVNDANVCSLAIDVLIAMGTQCPSVPVQTAVSSFLECLFATHTTPQTPATVTTRSLAVTTERGREIHVLLDNICSFSEPVPPAIVLSILNLLSNDAVPPWVVVACSGEIARMCTQNGGDVLVGHALVTLAAKTFMGLADAGTLTLIEDATAVLWAKLVFSVVTQQVSPHTDACVLGFTVLEKLCACPPVTQLVTRDVFSILAVLALWGSDANSASALVPVHGVSAAFRLLDVCIQYDASVGFTSGDGVVHRNGLVRASGGFVTGSALFWSQRHKSCPEVVRSTLTVLHRVISGYVASVRTVFDFGKLKLETVPYAPSCIRVPLNVASSESDPQLQSAQEVDRIQKSMVLFDWVKIRDVAMRALCEHENHTAFVVPALRLLGLVFRYGSDAAGKNLRTMPHDDLTPALTTGMERHFGDVEVVKTIMHFWAMGAPDYCFPACGPVPDLVRILETYGAEDPDLASKAFSTVRLWRKSRFVWDGYAALCRIVRLAVKLQTSGWLEVAGPALKGLWASFNGVTEEDPDAQLECALAITELVNAARDKESASIGLLFLRALLSTPLVVTCDGSCPAGSRPALEAVVPWVEGVMCEFCPGLLPDAAHAGFIMLRARQGVQSYKCGAVAELMTESALALKTPGPAALAFLWSLGKLGLVVNTIVKVVLHVGMVGDVGSLLCSLAADPKFTRFLIDCMVKIVPQFEGRVKFSACEIQFFSTAFDALKSHPVDVQYKAFPQMLSMLRFGSQLYHLANPSSSMIPVFRKYLTSSAFLLGFFSAIEFNLVPEYAVLSPGRSSGNASDSAILLILRPFLECVLLHHERLSLESLESPETQELYAAVFLRLQDILAAKTADGEYRLASVEVLIPSLELAIAKLTASPAVLTENLVYAVTLSLKHCLLRKKHGQLWELWVWVPIAVRFIQGQGSNPSPLLVCALVQFVSAGFGSHDSDSRLPEVLTNRDLLALVSSVCEKDLETARCVMGMMVVAKVDRYFTSLPDVVSFVNTVLIPVVMKAHHADQLVQSQAEKVLTDLASSSYTSGSDPSSSQLLSQCIVIYRHVFKVLVIPRNETAITMAESFSSIISSRLQAHDSAAGRDFENVVKWFKTAIQESSILPK